MKNWKRTLLLIAGVLLMVEMVFGWAPTPAPIYQPSDPNFLPPSPLMQDRIVKWQGEQVTGEIDVVDVRGDQPALSGAGFTFSLLPAKTILVAADPNRLARQFTFAGSYTPSPVLVGRIYAEVTVTNTANETHKRSLEINYVRKQQSPIVGCRMQ